MSNKQRQLIAGVLIVIGILALVVGILYFTIEAKSLPSILGQLRHFHGHRTKRGIAAVVVGVLLVAGGIGTLRRRPQPR